MAKRITPEGSTLRTVMDLLAVKRILAFRMQVGAFQGEHNGRKRFMRVGTPGMADVLAFCNVRIAGGTQPLWIEVKSPTGRQSPEQQSFQRQVEADGHGYLLVRDVQELIDWLRERGL